MKIIFLGGAFWDSNEGVVLRNSLGFVQSAADALQKNYVNGLVINNKVDSIDFINLTFLSAYPNGYRYAYYKPIKPLVSKGKCTVTDVSFINISFVRVISRSYNAIVRLYRSIYKYNNQNEKKIIVFCYSMHLPFLIACITAKFIFNKVVFCVIVPDLPEYMANRKGIKKIFYNLIAKLSYSIVRRLDCVVAITQQMLDKLKATKGVVVEGMGEDIERFNLRNRVDRYFLYSGTLDNRYGVVNLIQSFVEAKIDNYSLVICGDGDAKNYVIQSQRSHSCIEYLGQLPRAEVLELQRNAHVLVNPRDNNSEFTKYSFPSKIIEYMLSGTPILMYKLDGIPNDYLPYVYLIDDYNSCLTTAISQMTEKSIEELATKGLCAREFILSEKKPEKQVAKVIEYIKAEFGV